MLYIFQEDPESIMNYLLLSCKVSVEFWQNGLAWLRDNGIQISALKERERDLIFRKFEITDDFTLINHRLLWGKFYLYCSRCDMKTVGPSLSCFIARTR